LHKSFVGVVDDLRSGLDLWVGEVMVIVPVGIALGLGVKEGMGLMLIALVGISWVSGILVGCGGEVWVRVGLSEDCCVVQAVTNRRVVNAKPMYNHALSILIEDLLHFQSIIGGYDPLYIV